MRFFASSLLPALLLFSLMMIRNIIGHCKDSNYLTFCFRAYQNIKRRFSLNKHQSRLMNIVSGDNWKSLIFRTFGRQLPWASHWWGHLLCSLSWLLRGSEVIPNNNWLPFKIVTNYSRSPGPAEKRWRRRQSRTSFRR